MNRRIYQRKRERTVWFCCDTGGVIAYTMEYPHRTKILKTVGIWDGQGWRGVGKKGDESVEALPEEIRNMTWEDEPKPLTIVTYEMDMLKLNIEENGRC